MQRSIGHLAGKLNPACRFLSQHVAIRRRTAPCPNHKKRRDCGRGRRCLERGKGTSATSRGSWASRSGSGLRNAFASAWPTSSTVWSVTSAHSLFPPV